MVEGGGGDRKHESAVCQNEGVERQRKGSQDLAITGALTKEFLGSLYCATVGVSVCVCPCVCACVRVCLISSAGCVCV